jgi:uncharacterized protein (TIGR00290 family)
LCDSFHESYKTVAEPIIISWSGGKDSALALYELIQRTEFKVKGLVTTVTRDYQRVSIHGVRRVLLKRQAAALGYPLKEVFISKGASNDEYEKQMDETLDKFLGEGISNIAFGDIFLADLRAYRETKLANLGFKAVFPIWKTDTLELAHRFIKLGFKAVVTCVDLEVLDGGFAGRAYDESFLRDLPDGVDPCGENGEFHSFVFDGPVFKHPLKVKRGETVVMENRFCYSDLLPD